MLTMRRNSKMISSYVLKIFYPISDNVFVQLVRQELALKEKELDVKFRETAAYRNMKNLLEKKNVQIKELRGRMAAEKDSQDYLPDE